MEAIATRSKDATRWRPSLIHADPLVVGVKRCDAEYAWNAVFILVSM